MSTRLKAAIVAVLSVALFLLIGNRVSEHSSNKALEIHRESQVIPAARLDFLQPYPASAQPGAQQNPATHNGVVTANRQSEDSTAAYPAQRHMGEYSAPRDKQLRQYEVLEVIPALSPEAFRQFLQQNSHIVPEQLTLRQLEQLRTIWVAETQPNAPSGQQASASSFPLGNNNVIATQTHFASSDRMLYIHYMLPADYAADYVLIKFYSPNGDIWNLDRYNLTAPPGLMQEVWFRKQYGWTPGEYYAEVYRADGELTPIAFVPFVVE